MRTLDLRYNETQQNINTMNAVFINKKQSNPDFGFVEEVHKHTP